MNNKEGCIYGGVAAFMMMFHAYITYVLWICDYTVTSVVFATLIVIGYLYEIFGD